MGQQAQNVDELKVGQIAALEAQFLAEVQQMQVKCLVLVNQIPLLH